MLTAVLLNLQESQALVIAVYFHDPGRESKQNFWNVSEISLSRREHAVKNSRLP